MNLKRLLEFYGLDTTKKIKVARHKDEKRGYNLPRLHQMGQLGIYQSYQEKSDFHGCDYLVTFLGTDNNQAILVGVFEVKGFQKASEVPLPPDFFYYDIYKPSRKYYYELEEVPGFEDLIDRLVINWSGGAINWVQRLDSRDKEVVQLLPKGYVSHFPGYLNFILSYDQLKKVMENLDAHKEWHKMLSVVAGIYLIVDTSSGKQYIGSASGKDGILGRFKIYAKNADGGNVELKKLIDVNPLHAQMLQFTLLETLPISLPAKEILAREELYKMKLGSRNYGLNLN